jgi:hypothetical protein
MNAHERRQYEMLLRLRDFSNTHKDLFAASPLAQEAFGNVNAAIDELTATDLLKLSASVAARADRKVIARRALSELLAKVSQLARVLRARGQAMAPFLLPAARSDQDLLTTARQFARDAEPFDAEFSGHGVGPNVIAAAAAALEMAVRDRGMKRADHTAARTRIRDLLAAAFLDVRRLDLIVDNELATDNNPIRAVWKQARRIERARGPRGGSTGDVTTPSPTPAPESATEPLAPAGAIDESQPATVIQMPSREAA